MVVPVVRSGGLVLGPWTEDDVPAVLRLSADPQTRRWSSSLRTVETADDARRWLAARLTPDRLEWAVRDPATGRPLARVGLHHLEIEERTAEVAYAVLPESRGQGLAQAAVTAALDHGFGPLGLVRVALRHAVPNRASCHVALGCGFSLEGVERSAWPGVDGGPRDDVHLHGRLATDPPAPVPALAPRTPVEVVAGAYQLRPWAASDAAEVLAAADDPELARWNRVDATDLATARAWCADRADWDGTHASWAVRDAVDGGLLGSVSLHALDPVNASGEVGYWVVPRARGHGVGTAALLAAARFGFSALGLERVELFHAVDNGASCLVATRAGFSLEGTLRSSYRYGDGRLHDEHSHARLAGDPHPVG